MKRIEKLLELFNEESRNDFKNPEGRSLYLLLEEYMDDLPELDERFTKTFRQNDVTGSGGIDMAIWNLLNSNSSKTFWKLFERVQDEKKI